MYITPNTILEYKRAMRDFFSIVLTLCIFVPYALASPTLQDSKVYTEWVTLNFSWDATHSFEGYVSSGQFIPENCALAGINIDKNGEIYVTVPRWRPGVPATLNKLKKVSTSGSDYFMLDPYPSWDMQQVIF
jgi:hypothetical protein